jgi:pimeloyl-ACP methyl ester carboxylesterase
MNGRVARVLGLVALVGVLGCRGPRAQGPEAPCTHVQATREAQGTVLCEDVWTCGRPPGGRFDRIGLHRLAPCEAVAGPVVLYLPGMHMNGELAIATPRNDLRVYLAVAGVRTWGVDYRTHAVPADAKPEDLAALAGWTSDVFVDDAAWAAGFVRGLDPGPLVVAGFSQGATLGYRLAARAHAGLAGLVALDGVADPPSPPDGNGPAIDVGGSRLPFPVRRTLLAQVLADPAAPSPLPGFATAGDALAGVLYSAKSFGGNGGLANTRDGVSDVRVLAALLSRYDRWWPRAALDAPPPKPSGTPLPVLAFASTKLGSEWVDRVTASARAFGADAATVRVLPGYGHLDVLVSRAAARAVYAPTLSWLTGAR